MYFPNLMQVHKFKFFLKMSPRISLPYNLDVPIARRGQRGNLTFSQVPQILFMRMEILHRRILRVRRVRLRNMLITGIFN